MPLIKTAGVLIWELRSVELEDLYNRQLHPDERQWISNNLKAFEAFYQNATGQTITDQQASDMLLTAGFQRVDSTAANSTSGNALATQFLASAPGDLFYATPVQRANPNLGANADGSLTPEQAALQGVPPNPALGLGIAAATTGGLAIAAYGSEILAGASDAFAAYKAAQAGYSLTTAAATGAAVSGGTYTVAAAATAFINYWNTGQTFTSSFDQKFSLAGLAAASTVGVHNSMWRGGVWCRRLRGWYCRDQLHQPTGWKIRYVEADIGVFEVCTSIFSWNGRGENMGNFNCHLGAWGAV